MALAILASTPRLYAQITSIPNADGSDLALNVTVSTNIDLSQAANGSWTSSSANPGKGTYDANQWAVVFKYSSVNIAPGATVTFSNHITHAPVVWLVSSNVTINGNLSLDGQNYNNDPINLPEPGPGGFRGGSGTYNILGRGPGFGPGGGASSYQPGTYATSYGNAQLLPLIGGSGGASGVNGSENGGGGGGAILIAAKGAISFGGAGSVHAIGGNGNPSRGSGGGIRLVANQILGVSGSSISALGFCPTCPAEIGIVRLETTNLSSAINITPTTQAVAPSNTPTIFPVGAATVSVLSVSNANGLVTAPLDPRAVMSPNVGADDITLVTTNTVTIRLQALNFPTNGAVTVFVKQRNNVPQTTYQASFVSGTFATNLWQVPNVPLAYPAHTIIQARAAY